MQTTTTTMTVKDHVQAIVSGKILARLEGKGAEELNSLIEAVRTVQTTHGSLHQRQISTTTLPKSVVLDTLNHLRSLKMVRNFPFGNIYGVYKLVVLPGATRAQALDAIERYYGFDEESPPFLDSRIDLAKQISEFEAANVPELGDSSQAEDAYLYEGSVTSALEAESVPWINNEHFELYAESEDMDDAAFANYLRTTSEQAAANAERARRAATRAWLATDEGQLWISHQREIQAEREAVHSAQEDTDSTTMSPEQAHLDHISA